MNREKIARLFHNTYEELAPQFGYETREDTKEFDPESKNGKLMLEVWERVVKEILQQERERIIRHRELENGKEELSECGALYNEDCEKNEAYREEYKTIIKFINKLIKELEAELKLHRDSLDDYAIKGSQRYMIKYLKVWKQILKEDYVD